MQQNNKRVLLTGGLGYVGSHTAAVLLDAGYDVTIVDDCSNSFPHVLDRLRRVSSGTVELINADISSNTADVAAMFASHMFMGIIHFAAHVSVPESFESPEKYRKNNIGTLKTALALAMGDSRRIPLVFSSSASVYGSGSTAPLREDAPCISPISPYAATKQTGELMLQRRVGECRGKATALRYFNPAGAHPSGLLGEHYRMPTFHLVPALCEAALGRRETFTIFGTDYPTPDGTCVRDYVHVMDVARAHVAALERLEDGPDNMFEIFNVGSGTGYSVRTMVEEFQKVNGVVVPCGYADRRAGDPPYLVADIVKAREGLKWEPQQTLADMLSSAWRWEQQKPDPKGE